MITQKQIDDLEETLKALKARKHNEELISQSKHFRNTDYIFGICKNSRTKRTEYDDEDESRAESFYFVPDRKLTQLLNKVIKDYMEPEAECVS